MKSFETHGEEETIELGRRIAATLSRRAVVLLIGNLGAGKTTLAKGIISGLGAGEVEDVTSPTFTLIHEYGEGRVYHIDLYRLDEGASAAHAVDLDELLSDEQAVLIIEWADRMGRYPLPPGAWRVSITGDGDAPRTISINELE